MSWLIALYETLTLHAMLLLLGGISLGWNAVAMVLYPILPDAKARAIGRRGIARCYHMFWTVAQATGIIRLEASALAPLRDRQGLIIAANHPSLLDAALLTAHLPLGACIMKASLMRNVFLGAAARLAHYIRNDVAIGMVRNAVLDLQRGGQLIVFPEGTRTTRPPLNELQPGITYIAKLAAAPIQTVLIETTSPYLGKGWPLWRKPPLPIVFTVRLGERFQPEADHRALLARLDRYFHDHLAPRAERRAA